MSKIEDGIESKHTPGPWEVHDDHPERACIYIRQTEAPYWADIAALYHAPGEEDEKDITGIWRNDPVRVANARLIAAAPDLRAVCSDFEITGPDADGLIWLVLHGTGTNGKAMFNLGASKNFAAQVALNFEAERRAALSRATGETANEG